MSSDIRSLLFTPGTRPDRFARAAASGADIVCLDLEDAVPPDRKAEARLAVLSALKAKGGEHLAVRVNSPRTAEGVRDLAALLDGGALPALLLVPKTESADDLRALHDVFQGSLPLCSLIETAAGLRAAWDIAAAPSVTSVLFGGVDMSADLGVGPGWEPLLFARSRLVAACAASGRALLDSPATDVADLEGLAASATRARALGFTGRACVHPDQVGIVNAAYSPDAAEIDWARRVLTTFDAAVGGPALLDGKLIERPVALAAQRVLARAALSAAQASDIVPPSSSPGVK